LGGNRRGIVLLLALFFLMLMALMGTTMIRLVPIEMVAAGRAKTDAEAHFGITAAMKQASAWLFAVQSSANGATSQITYLGDNWTKPFDPFSVPNTDPNFRRTTVSALTCPYGKLGSDLTLLGFKRGVNLTNADYDGMNSAKGTWAALRCTTPLTLNNGGSDTVVYTYIIPDAETNGQVDVPSGSLRRTYRVTCIAYQNGLPRLRAHTILQEDTYAKYAWFSDLWGTDAAGNLTQINVSGTNSVIADGPFHTNQAPIISVADSYWASNSSTGRKAFMGAVTYAGNSSVNSSLTPNHDDGVAWVGGNYNGSDPNKRPTDSTGSPIFETANNMTRHQRIIEGGANNLRRINSISLPPNLAGLQEAAFGSTNTTAPNYTGLALNQVDPNQRSGSTAVANVTFPEIRNSGGAVTTAAGQHPVNTDRGLFVNTKNGTYEAAGGVAVKADTRSMTLEVVDAAGNIISNVNDLETGNFTGNPSIRVQSNSDSYDANLTQNYNTYYNNGTVNSSVASGYTPCTHNSTVPTWVPPSGSGSGMTAGYWSYPATGGPQHPGGHNTTSTPTGPPVTDWEPTTVTGPRAFKPVDWVVETSNTEMQIPWTITRNSSTPGWRNGVGGNMAGSTMGAARNDVSDLNINDVYVHDLNSPTGTKIMPGNNHTVPLGKIAIFKQNRSDMDRLDVFIVDADSSNPTPLNGAVFSTDNIYSMRGVNLGRRTVAAGNSTAKTISINDNLWQAKTVRGSKPVNAQNGLGLVAESVNFRTDESRWNSTAQKMYVYASIIAGRSTGSGGLDVSRADNGNWTALGCASGQNPTYELFGGLIERKSKARMVGARDGTSSTPSIPIWPPCRRPSSRRPMLSSRRSISRSASASRGSLQNALEKAGRVSTRPAFSWASPGAGPSAGSITPRALPRPRRLPRATSRGELAARAMDRNASRWKPFQGLRPRPARTHWRPSG